MKNNKLFNYGLKAGVQSGKDLEYIKLYLSLVEDGNLDNVLDLISDLYAMGEEPDEVLCMMQDADYINEDIIHFSFGFTTGVMKNIG